MCTKREIGRHIDRRQAESSIAARSSSSEVGYNHPDEGLLFAIEHAIKLRMQRSLCRSCQAMALRIDTHCLLTTTGVCISARIQ